MSFSTGLRHRRWTDHDRAMLRAWASAGQPTLAIARHLGRTRLAVRIMACRMGVQLDSPRGRPRNAVQVPGVRHPITRVLSCPVREARRLAFLAAEAALDRLLGVAPPDPSPPRPRPGPVWRTPHPSPHLP